MNLSEKIKMITFLGEEYPVACSNSAKLMVSKKYKMEDLKAGKIDVSFEDMQEVLVIMINDGIRLSNFIKKEQKPNVDEEEIAMLMDFATEDEIVELFNELNEFIKQSK